MPFADYKDFSDCVKKNGSKKNPKAYCATIERKVKEEMDPKQVIEILDVSEAEFNTDDAGRMTGKVTIIKAGRAKGKRRVYTSNALRKAVKEGVYNGLRMFVNHSDKPPIKRSVGELVSAVESTEYDAKEDRIIGNLEFFNKEFFDYAQAARKYIGVSAAHRIRVAPVREGKEVLESVQEIVNGHSVDWVVYPAAGGEIISFARESEGADDVEWDEVTLELLKEKAPTVFEQIKTELAKESAGPDDPDDDDGEEGGEEVKLSKESITKLVKEALEEHDRSTADLTKKREDTQKKVREYVSKSGLPEPIRPRLISQFSNATEYVESEVKEAVESANAELKALGFGARVNGMGPTTGAASTGKTHSVREGVENIFGVGKEKSKATAGAASGKES